MEFSVLDIVLNIINIVVLFVILKILVYKPVLKFVRARSESIEHQLQNAREVEQKANALHEQYEKELAQCDEKVKQTIREGTQRANKTADEIIEKADKKAETIVSEANEKANAECKNRLEGMRDEIAEISVDIAKQILQREINESDNERLIDEFFRKAE